MSPYCHSRYASKRQATCEVNVGHVGVGKDHPIRIQSMTTTVTQDEDATAKQVIDLAEAGCDIVRITAPNPSASRALKGIHKKVRKAGIDVPLVADIHFLPSAAMEAIEHVEKVRINPGNYADKKRFKTREYSEQEYDSELQRLYEKFSPLVIRAKELGRALRIGTNHGSLSDRIMNRYGDTPLGMTESALEFIRIAESHGFKDIILSMKASNPKIMIEAYRLTVAKMHDEDMHYPLHLGVTEAGDGEDARIKSAIGIGSLLYDGLGDTIRVSLTEDPVLEVPVAQDLADKAMKLWAKNYSIHCDSHDSIDPYTYSRRLTNPLILSENCQAGTAQPPRVIVPISLRPAETEKITALIKITNPKLENTPIEGILLSVQDESDLDHISNLSSSLKEELHCIALNLPSNVKYSTIKKHSWESSPAILLRKRFDTSNIDELKSWLSYSESTKTFMVIDLDLTIADTAMKQVKSANSKEIIFTLSQPYNNSHPAGSYRRLTELLNKFNISAPIWISCTDKNNIGNNNDTPSQLLDSSMFAGNLFCDGIGDFLSIETEPDLERSTKLAYNILQGARMRSSKTEFVACPSCGRTLFDLQTTTQRIRSKTGHIKGLTIAVMGCIVNGPGEMADADFGYVGGTPGKVNLYVGKECVNTNIPEDEAVERLIELIRENNKWQDAV